MRTHVTTYADHAYAVADPHLRRNWSCECRVLLGRPHAAASVSGSLHLGDPCRAASPSGEESIRYASRAISAHGCVVWFDFCLVASCDFSGPVLLIQLLAVGTRFG